MSRWDITGTKKMKNNEELSEIVFVNNLECNSSNCDCSDPGTGSDSCECEDR